LFLLGHCGFAGLREEKLGVAVSDIFNEVGVTWEI
jgi:hypothetical protein